MEVRIAFFGRKGCLLTDKIEQLLRRSDNSVEVFLSEARGQALPEKILNWRGDLLISFRNLVVLPTRLLESARLAVNFHPGPPEYPGSGCVNYALLDGATNFGVTAHIMSEVVDSGPILEVRRFPVAPSDNIDTLLKTTHNELFQLAQDLIQKLISVGVEGLDTFSRGYSSRETWSPKRRAITHLDALQELDPTITREELELKRRALHTESFPLYFRLHGYKFELNTNET